MTLGKAAAGVVHTGEGIYNIGFHGNDAVQFPARDLMDLLERWIDFCAEHEIQTNSHLNHDTCLCCSYFV